MKFKYFFKQWLPWFILFVIFSILFRWMLDEWKPILDQIRVAAISAALSAWLIRFKTAKEIREEAISKK